MNNDWLYVVLEAAILVGIFAYYFRYNGIYHPTVKSVLLVMTGFNAWAGVMEVAFMLTNLFTAVIFGAILTCGILFADLITQLHRADETVILSEYERGSLHETVGQSAERLLALLRSKDAGAKRCPANDYLITAFMATHAGRCPNQMCGARSLCKKGELLICSHRVQVICGLLMVISVKFKETLIKTPRATLVSILYSGFLLNQIKNYILSWEVVERARWATASITEKLQLEYCR